MNGSKFLVAAVASLICVSSAFAGGIPQACKSKKLQYDVAGRNYKAAVKAVTRAERNLQIDEIKCQRALDKNQIRYDKVIAQLEFLNSQQIGGFVGTVFGGGYGVNQNITLNSKINALKKNRGSLEKERANLQARCDAGLARDQENITKSQSQLAAYTAAFVQIESDLIACVSNPNPVK